MGVVTVGKCARFCKLFPPVGDVELRRSCRIWTLLIFILTALTPTAIVTLVIRFSRLGGDLLKAHFLFEILSVFLLFLRIFLVPEVIVVFVIFMKKDFEHVIEKMILCMLLGDLRARL